MTETHEIHDWKTGTTVTFTESQELAVQTVLGLTIDHNGYQCYTDDFVSELTAVLQKYINEKG